LHRSSDGSSAPTFQVADEELDALALALRDCGKGVMQMIVDFEQPQAAFASMRALVERSGRPLSFTMIEGLAGYPEFLWANILDWCAAAIEQGLPIKGQVLGRAVGLMFGHELTLNPFYSADSYRALSELPFDARIAQLRLPQLRARILAEPIDTNPANVLGTMVRDFNSMFLLGDPPNYEPSPEQSIAAQAARRGVSPQELAYDLMLERDGRNLLYYAITNYAHGGTDG
jgi:N-acyl-D-aspartate/D-glutamate deacylase